MRFEVRVDISEVWEDVGHVLDVLEVLSIDVVVTRKRIPNLFKGLLVTGNFSGSTKKL